MSFVEMQNVYNDIPGFDTSKGECIVKALRRLWAKIEHLEQIRNSERQLQSKEVQMNSIDEDLTTTGVQYKLLVLQLKYIRSIIRKNWDTSNSVSHDQATASVKNSHEENCLNPNIRDEFNSIDFKNQLVCEGTQTGNSLIEGIDPLMSMEFDRYKDRADAQVSTDNLPFKFGASATQTASNSQKALTTCSKPHYHLKLDDVPFILGASSTASHSVVANVQNIIAMMKTHNRALCGPKHHSQRAATAVNTYATKTDPQDSSKMLLNLSQELHELGLKQAALAKRFEIAEGKNLASNACDDITAHCNKSKANKSDYMLKKSMTATNIPKRTRSISESTKVEAAVANSSTKRVSSNTKYQANTLPIVARRKFLRSLQNFKSHLSEEDISWK